MCTVSPLRLWTLGLTILAFAPPVQAGVPLPNGRQVENVDFERLEVSSPGLDRPVKRLADYARFAGHEAQLTLRAPIDGARRIRGILRGTEGEDILVETPAGVKSFPFGTISRARLVPAIDWRKGH